MSSTVTEILPRGRRLDEICPAERWQLEADFQASQRTAAELRNMALTRRVGELECEARNMRGLVLVYLLLIAAVGVGLRMQNGLWIGLVVAAVALGEWYRRRS